MNNETEIFGIAIFSFEAFSEIVTISRALRSGRVPTGITLLGWVPADAKRISRTANKGRFWREIYARSVLVVLLIALISSFFLLT
jgi:hypothetical protein